MQYVFEPEMLYFQILPETYKSWFKSEEVPFCNMSYDLTKTLTNVKYEDPGIYIDPVTEIIEMNLGSPNVTHVNLYSLYFYVRAYNEYEMASYRKVEINIKKYVNYLRSLLPKQSINFAPQF